MIMTTMPPAAMPSTTTTAAMPTATAMAPPIGVGSRRSQQTSSDGGCDQQGLEAHHGLNSFISIDRNRLHLKR